MPSPFAVLSSQGRANPYEYATNTALARYPWLRTLGVPLKLMSGKGEGMSESFDPKAEEENPYPGNFTVQIRDPRLQKDTKLWPATLGREGMDYMARHDPYYQGVANKFQATMTPRETHIARNRYDSNDMDVQKSYTYPQFLNKAENQEFIGGYVFDMGDWRKNAGYSPLQKRLLDALSQHMWQGQTPTPLNFPEQK